MRVAVTGAGGRLGRALIAALADAPFTGLSGPIAWDRTAFDLDRPETAIDLLQRDRPELVVHAAAWTDVDGAARDPELALTRNGRATGVLAEGCAEAGVDLIVVSTNEVFGAERTDGRGWRPDDPAAPANPYGASKLAGERAARAAYDAPRPTGGAAGSVRRRPGPALAVVRTAWLYGPPGNDFPSKIVLAALRARAAGEVLKVVGDEFGSPTSSADLAEAIVERIGSGEIGGVVHYVNIGAVSRAAWAAAILRAVALDVPIEEVPAATWIRASNPPRWAVLESSPLPSGEPMRPWTEALADDVPFLTRLATGEVPTGTATAAPGSGR
jgi:dTDP-4-dehydrorhamnose reductase